MPELARFPWAAFLGAAEVGAQPEAVVNQLSAVEQLAKLLTDTPVELWREYLKFHYIVAHAPVLSKEIDATAFASS